MFAGAAVPWLVITVVYLAIMFALSMIPLLGQFAVSLLNPVLVGGILLGCREQDRGGTLAVAHLFAGFHEKLGPLVILALLYFAGWLVIGFIAVALVMTAIGGGAFAAMMSGDALQAGVRAPVDDEPRRAARPAPLRAPRRAAADGVLVRAGADRAARRRAGGRDDDELPRRASATSRRS